MKWFREATREKKFQLAFDTNNLEKMFFFILSQLILNSVFFTSCVTFLVCITVFNAHIHETWDIMEIRKYEFIFSFKEFDFEYIGLYKIRLMDYQVTFLIELFLFYFFMACRTSILWNNIIVYYDEPYKCFVFIFFKFN